MKATTFNAIMEKAVKMQTVAYEDYNAGLMSLSEVRAVVTEISGMYECLKLITELEGVERDDK